MKGLKTQNNRVLHVAEKIVWNEAESVWELYYNDTLMSGKTIDDNYSVVEFDEAELPEVFVPYKYIFEDGHFVADPDFDSTPPMKFQLNQIEQSVQSAKNDIQNNVRSISNNQSKINEVDEENDEISLSLEEALCDIDETYNARLGEIEDAICEIAEALNS